MLFFFCGIMRALIVAPHPDDAELLCGGLIARLVTMGVEVFIVITCDANVIDANPAMKRRRRAEAWAAAQTLGIKRREQLIFLGFENRSLTRRRNELQDKLYQLAKRLKPGVVIIPGNHDIHEDHIQVNLASQRVFQDVRMLLGCENPLNTDGTFRPNIHVLLTQAQVETQIQAASQHATEAMRSKKFDYFDPEYLTSYARGRYNAVRAAGNRINSDHPGNEFWGAERYELMRAVG